MISIKKTVTFDYLYEELFSLQDESCSKDLLVSKYSKPFVEIGADKLNHIIGITLS